LPQEWLFAALVQRQGESVYNDIMNAWVVRGDGEPSFASLELPEYSQVDVSVSLNKSVNFEAELR